jgi:eukaryotic-like serine/threonine-protein kinase
VQQEQLTLKLGTTVRDPSRERYVIEGLLGKGGFGAVYLARDKRDRKRLFALKEIINPDERDRERFIFEGEVLKRLDHRALPRVYQVFENDKLKRVYILMDYIKGRDLKALREEQPDQRFSLPLVLALMAPVVDAIMYLHRQDPPVVHRDIKPANIIVPVGADEAILVDFGSAKESLPDDTTDIIRHGSPGYAALEQYHGGTTPRTDIYGLGATFYTLLTGMIPADAIIRAEASKRFDPLEPAHLIVPEVTWAVATVIERAMSISREDRFETVEQFWQELTAYAPQQQQKRAALIAGITSQPILPAGQNAARIIPARSSYQQHNPPVRRGRTFLTLILALLLILIIGIGLFVAFVGHSIPPAVLHMVTPTLVPPTMTHQSSIYPQLAPSYAGTGVDLMNNEKTAMFLTHLQQSQGKIRGDFQGLGLVGPFTGTVAPDGQVHFTVKDPTADLTIAFEGVIKVGGDMVGTFAVLDPNGTHTGESGLWNLAANP